MEKGIGWLETDAPTAAQRLLGCVIERELNGQTLRGRIVETEAYDQSDPASHSFRGQTPRNAVMFGPAGFLYVYFTYGMHYCCNVVVGEMGHGSAVLIRALEPLAGLDEMRTNRLGASDNNLTNGPAKLCQAFAITKSLNGHNLTQPPLVLIEQPPIPDEQIQATPRIGIKQAIDVPWRFIIAGTNARKLPGVLRPSAGL